MNKQQVIQQTKEYIAGLELPECDPKMSQVFRPEAAAFQDEKESAAVNAGNLLSFMANVPVQNRSDMLNSILLAQLAADKKFSRFNEVEEWYKLYTSILGKLGWQNNQFAFEEYIPPAEVFTLEDIILELLKKKVSEGELSLLQKTLDIFSDLPNDDRRRVEVYEKFSVYLPFINLQVGVVASSLLMMNMGIIFQTKQKIKRLFQEEFLVSMLDSKITIVSYTNLLNEEVYKNLREEVIKKLGKKRDEFILDLDISE